MEEDHGVQSYSSHFKTIKGYYYGEKTKVLITAAVGLKQ